MVHVYAWTCCSYIFVIRFSQDRTEGCGDTVPRFCRVGKLYGNQE